MALTTGYKTDLDHFIKEFDSESKLHRVIADLLGKMGREEVRITHGTGERGKDIVFYAKGGMGERRLFACVVKNKAITGDVSSPSGAKAALNQAEQAFDEPHINLKGEEEWVDSVYVISPPECSPLAIESIKGRLRRRGQVDFFCGRRLLDLFSQFWPEFLWFESSILQSYLSGLRTGLQQDKALVNLILRKSMLSEAPKSFFEIYILPTFYRELATYKITFFHSFHINLFKRSISKRKLINTFCQMTDIAGILSTASMWEAEKEKVIVFEHAAHDTKNVIQFLDASWEKGFNEFAAKIAKEQGHAALSSLSKNTTPVHLTLSTEQMSKVEEIAETYTSGMVSFEKYVNDASKFAGRFNRNVVVSCFDFLNTKECLDHSKISSMARLLPFAIERNKSTGKYQYDECFLDHFDKSVLIAGPAGHGKTSFCKWAAIRDAHEMSQNKGNVLPVYFPLHGLSFGNIESFEKTFFKSKELQQLVESSMQGSATIGRIRLYLDGLDEVTTESRKKEIVELVRQAIEKIPTLQVIITSRDHVVGPWLGWLPRIEISEFTDEQVRQLVGNWVENETGIISEFYENLNKNESLSALMRVPLLGTLILALFRRVKELPPSRVKLYELFVELLCGGWDAAKEIKRECRYGPEDRTIVLTRLAVLLHFNNKRDALESEIKSAITTCVPLFRDKYKEFLHELLEDGLLVQTGNSFTFCHLSFQEFLVARDLNDPTGLRPNQALRWFYRGDDWWREVICFYLGMSTRPFETEQWLVKTAKKSASTGHNRKDVEARLEFLRRNLGEAFPGYKSKLPEKPLGLSKVEP